jgi:putative ABC transport system substrate-binding protein
MRWVTVIWLCCCILLLIPGRIAAKNQPRILVITSDASVEKYREPQEEFKQMIAQPVLEVNLGDKKWDISEIEELFYDEDPDVIYCIGTKAYLIANKYANKKPIVFSSIINWLRLPITDKTYGVSNELHAGMELTLFRYLFPQMKTIGVLYSKQYTEQWFKTARTDAKEMGIDILGQAVQKEKTISDLKKLLPQVDAFWLISDPDLISDKKELLAILKECHTQKIPVFSYHEAFATLGAVLVVSADNRTIGRQAANIATEVLAGNTLNEKVQFPAGSRIILNLSKVKEYGLEYNKAALGSVNEIIEE